MLRHLKQELCPTCGAVTVAMSRKPQNHYNGQQFEERTYACGSGVRWVPNYNAEEPFGQCRKSDEYKDIVKKRKAAHAALKAFIAALDVDDRWRNDTVSMGLNEHRIGDWY